MAEHLLDGRAAPTGLENHIRQRQRQIGQHGLGRGFEVARAEEDGAGLLGLVGPARAPLLQPLPQSGGIDASLDQNRAGGGRFADWADGGHGDRRRGDHRVMPTRAHPLAQAQIELLNTGLGRGVRRRQQGAAGIHQAVVVEEDGIGGEQAGMGGVLGNVQRIVHRHRPLDKRQRMCQVGQRQAALTAELLLGEQLGLGAELGLVVAPERHDLIDEAHRHVDGARVAVPGRGRTGEGGGVAGLGQRQAKVLAQARQGGQGHGGRVGDFEAQAVGAEVGRGVLHHDRVAVQIEDDVIVVDLWLRKEVELVARRVTRVHPVHAAHPRAQVAQLGGIGGVGAVDHAHQDVGVGQPAAKPAHRQHQPQRLRQEFGVVLGDTADQDSHQALPCASRSVQARILPGVSAQVGQVILQARLKSELGRVPQDFARARQVKGLAAL